MDEERDGGAREEVPELRMHPEIGLFEVPCDEDYQPKEVGWDEEEAAPEVCDCRGSMIVGRGYGYGCGRFSPSHSPCTSNIGTRAMS